MDIQLYLGVSRKDITPQIGGRLFGYRPDVYSESVNDNLSVTAFAFTCGNERFLMISACVCLIETWVTDSLRDEIAREYKIKRENILISATHTHSGPAMQDMPGWGDIDFDYYENIFKPNLLESVGEAFEKSEAVSVRFASGESYIGINRRELHIDNSVGLGQCRWGAFNPEMTVISFKNSEGKIVGNIIHYGCHGTCAGMNVEISRDWSGIMTDELERHSGGITAFFNGPEGDVGPRLSNGQTVGDITYVKEIGDIAARDAVGIFDKIKEYRQAEISSVAGKVRLPYEKRISYEAAVEGCSKYSLDAVNIDRQMAVYFNKVKDSYDNGYVEKEFDEIEQLVLKIGEVAFVGFPYELFSVIGMRIDDACNNLKVLSLSNVNGSRGYFPTEDQLCCGGYEVSMFKYNDVQSYKDDADFYLIKETLKNIEKA